MTRLEDLLGQSSAATLLGRMLERGRVPHALLFHGPEGVGKATAAWSFGTALLCEGHAAAPPCGTCPACRLAEHRNHPDLLLVERQPRRDSETDDEPEAEEPEGTGELRTFIVVEQIRKLTELAALAPRRGLLRAFIIDPADRMNPEAQNALLKTLEEPPGRTVVMLVASRPHLLLPTVRSRSVGVAFTPMPTALLAGALAARGMPPGEAAERAALAAGRPGRALALDLAELRTQRATLVAMLDALARGDATPLEQAKALAGDETDETLAALELLSSLVRDAARLGAGLEARTLVHEDLAPALGRIGARLGPARAAAIVTSIDDVAGSLRFNVNRTLAVEALLAAVAGGPLP